MFRLSETERAMALQRLEAADQRIADLEVAILRLKEKGQPTVEAERLLLLLRQSQIVMRQYFDLLAKVQTRSTKDVAA